MGGTSDDATDKAKIEAAKQKKIEERGRTRREIFEEVEESAKEAHDDIFLIHHDGGMELTDRSNPQTARAGWGAWVWQFNVYQQSDKAALQAGEPALTSREKTCQCTMRT